MRHAIRLFLVGLTAAAAGVGGGTVLARRPAMPDTSPYVAQQTSPVKGLSAQEVDDLLNGRGAGFARTAELNSYPGPRHVLDMRGTLALTETQAAAAQRIFTLMQRDAKQLGQEIVDRERELSAAFARRHITAAGLQADSDRLARMYGRLRAVHLQAHLELTALLTPEQIARYDALRGYHAGAEAGAEHSHEGG